MGLIKDSPVFTKEAVINETKTVYSLSTPSLVLRKKDRTNDLLLISLLKNNGDKAGESDTVIEKLDTEISDFVGLLNQNGCQFKFLATNVSSDNLYFDMSWIEDHSATDTPGNNSGTSAKPLVITKSINLNKFLRPNETSLVQFDESSKTSMKLQSGDMSVREDTENVKQQKKQKPPGEKVESMTAVIQITVVPEADSPNEKNMTKEPDELEFAVTNLVLIQKPLANKEEADRTKRQQQMSEVLHTPTGPVGSTFGNMQRNTSSDSAREPQGLVGSRFKYPGFASISGGVNFGSRRQNDGLFAGRRSSGFSFSAALSDNLTDSRRNNIGNNSHQSSPFSGFSFGSSTRTDFDRFTSASSSSNVETFDGDGEVDTSPPVTCGFSLFGATPTTKPMVTGSLFGVNSSAEPPAIETSVAPIIVSSNSGSDDNLMEVDSDNVCLTELEGNDLRESLLESKVGKVVKGDIPYEEGASGEVYTDLNYKRARKTRLCLAVNTKLSFFQDIKRGLNFEIGKFYLGKDDKSLPVYISGEDCCICQTEPVDTTVLGCGHTSTCSVCTEELMKYADKTPLRYPICPICRKTIRATYPVETFFNKKAGVSGGGNSEETWERNTHL